MTYIGQLPTDAIELQMAERKYPHSRVWFRNHVTIYYEGSPRKAYVSEAEVKKEHEASQQIIVRPPDKGRGDEDD